MDPVAMEFALAARRQLVLRSTDDPEVLAARQDDNKFCEWVFVDDQRGGVPIIQADHHKLWQEIAAEQKKAVVWFPIEHGKTTQVKFTLCNLLGKHPDRQYAYISSKHSQASKMVGAVKREIESNLRLQKVYPNLRPQRQVLTTALEEWGTTSIRVEGCPRGTRDASLVAYGLSGKILGSRLHGVIIDNALDSDNTNTDDLRKKVIERFKDEIFGRVMDGGFILFLDTAWFLDDALHHFSKQKGWYSVKLDAEVSLNGEDETLWPEQFPRERLDAKRDEELGQTAYDRQFRNMPMSETMNFFKGQFWDSAYARVPWFDDLLSETIGLNLEEEMRTGVDLAINPGETHDLSSFATVIGSGHRRRLINLQADRMDLMSILARIVSIYRAFHRPVNLAGGNAQFVVENNAAQDYVVQALHSAAVLQAIGLTQDEAADIRVVGRTTTSKRRDQELGIPSLVTGLETGRWDIAAGDQTKQLREEMRVWYPDAKHYGDRLMSVWFAAADMMATGAGFTVDYI